MSAYGQNKVTILNVHKFDRLDTYSLRKPQGDPDGYKKMFNPLKSLIKEEMWKSGQIGIHKKDLKRYTNYKTFFGTCGIDQLALFQHQPLACSTCIWVHSGFRSSRWGRGCSRTSISRIYSFCHQALKCSASPEILLREAFKKYRHRRSTSKTVSGLLFLKPVSFLDT